MVSVKHDKAHKSWRDGDYFVENKNAYFVEINCFEVSAMLCHVFFKQIIRRARQNYLTDEYVKKDLTLAQVLQDVTAAMKVE